VDDIFLSGHVANHQPFQNVTHSRNTRTIFAAATQRSGQYITSKNYLNYLSVITINKTHTDEKTTHQTVICISFLLKSKAHEVNG